MDEVSTMTSAQAVSGRSRFGRVAALISLVTPLAIVGLGLFLLGHARSRGIDSLPTVTSATIVSLGVLFIGGLSGAAALVWSSGPGDRRIRGIAILGVIINGLLLLLCAALPIILLAANRLGDHTTPEARLDKALKELSQATNDEHRFYALNDAAKESFELGKIDDARKFATELLALAPRFQGDWNYGNAIQDGNLVLGRIAVRENRIADAKRYLLAAGGTPGSPQLDSFGPNMSLARDLLEKGEQRAVLEYFESCRRFWKMDYQKLDQWSSDVMMGKTPDFGPNLAY